MIILWDRGTLGLEGSDLCLLQGREDRMGFLENTALYADDIVHFSHKNTVKVEAGKGFSAANLTVDSQVC